MLRVKSSNWSQVKFEGEISRINGIYYCPHFNSKPESESKSESQFGCSYSSKLKTSVETHIQFKHSDDKPFSCALCDHTWKSMSALRAHLRFHTGEKPFLCKIPGCSYASAKSGHLLEHKNTVHSTSRNFPCPSPGCEFAAKTKSTLQSHKKIHPEFQTKTYACPELNCNYKAKRQEHLKNHIASLHSDERPFKCPLTWPSGKCGYSAKKKEYLKPHMKIHVETGKKSCSFPGCQYKTRQGGHLKEHERGHLDELRGKVKCKFCSKSFKGQKGREKHERGQHTRETLFTCPLCDYKVANVGTLTIHIRKHTRETPYKCGECGKSGYYSSFLKTHEQIHERSRNKMGKVKESSNSAAETGTGSVEIYQCPNFTTGGKCTFSSTCLKEFVLHLDGIHKLPRVQL